MNARTVWRLVTEDQADLLDRVLAILAGVRFCVIGGQAVNAYVDPLVSLDLDLVIAADAFDAVETALRGAFHVEQFAHSLNISAPESDLRVQLQTDPRYGAFVDRATPRPVLGVVLPVAALEDVLQGKVWAASDPTRRASKRRKDVLDIERLLEARPDLRARVPAAILDQLQ